MLRIELSPQGNFLLVHLVGLVSPQAWEQALQDLEHAIEGAQGDRLVMDLRGLVGWLGVPERRVVGTLMARHLARMEKVALVIEAPKISGVVQAQAQQQGLDLRLFPNYDDAVNWALS